MKISEIFTKSADKQVAKTVADRLLGVAPVVPLSSIADGDTLVLGELRLRCMVSEPYTSRCSNCSTKSPDGKFAWIPDGTRMGDPLPALMKTEKANRFNGHASAWCIPCVLKLIKKGGGKDEPTVEKVPPRPEPAPPTPEEIEAQNKYHQACIERETRKHELAHALENRVLTPDEIREVTSHGIHIYTHSMQSYNEENLQRKLQTAWQIQTNLRMAEGK